MKIKESYLQEALKADRNRESNWTSEARRQRTVENSDAASKFRQTDSPLKDELKFASLLESSAKLQKNQQREDSGEERRDNQKRDKKHAAREKNSAENLTGDGKTEKYESSGGQTGGGQGGFGMGGNIGGLNLSEQFAARSILHAADLERMISIIKTQINAGGKREIILQLKRSVLEGLQVKIMTEQGAKVQIEFLAANEKTRSQIEKHSEELANILRGRGVNLGTLKTTLVEERNDNQSSEDERKIPPELTGSANAPNNDLPSDNTFISPAETDSRFYKA
ncbi:MAG: flagellar hook-length control protein FliK [Pyrinomonadaceae bacterium]